MAAIVRSAARLSRRRLLRDGAAALAGALAAPMLNFGRVEAAQGIRISSRAVDLVLATTVVDMLGLLTLDWTLLARWLGDPEALRDGDYRGLERTGVDVFHPAVETNDPEHPFEAALRWTTGWNRLLDGSPCFLDRVADPWDLTGVPSRGEIGIIIGFQNSNHFRTVADIEAFARLGQRVSQLTYNERNRIGCGCQVRDTGLTHYGVAVVAEMNRVGMAVDVSHCGERTSLEAISVSRQPVLVTHSNCKALNPGEPRCKSDRVIRAMAAKGGVMGITVVRGFVGRGWPSLSDLLDHYEHVARLVGVEHVGIGSDVDASAIDPRTRRPRDFYAIRGLDLPLRVFQIADGLLERGWSRDAVALALGGNFRRALAAIWPRQPGTPHVSGRDPFCPAPRKFRPVSG